VIRYLAGKLLLERPPLVQQQPEVIEFAGFEGILTLLDELLDHPKIELTAVHILHLLVKNCVGVTRDVCEEQQQAITELLPSLRTNSWGLDVYRATAAEPNHPLAAVSGDVLVLPPYRPLKYIQFDPAGLPGERFPIAGI
jgi:hypothetical protein